MKRLARGRWIIRLVDPRASKHGAAYRKAALFLNDERFLRGRVGGCGDGPTPPHSAAMRPSNTVRTLM